MTTTAGITRKLVWITFVQFLIILLLVFLGMWYVQRTEQKICGLVSTMDDAYVSEPPTTQTGKNIARQVHTYREAINCKGATQ